MYSKVKQCAVVVSEIAKSHGHNGESSGVKKHAALTAAVLIALGSLSFTTAFVPMTTEAAYKTRTDGSNFVGVERTDGLFEDSDYANHNGQGAHGDDSITIGLKASGGDGTITIGDRRAEKSLGSVYVGRGPGMPTGKVLPSETDDGYWATSVGYQSDATGYGSIAIGSNATANNSYDKDSTGHGIDLKTKSGDGKSFVLKGKPDIQRASVAIGYGASADNGNIAIGSYSDASTDLHGKEINSYLTNKKADSYVSVGKSDALRRISNVADGAANSDVATIAQLKEAVKETDASKKANIDASNIGKHLKFKADGKTAADSSDITTNEDAWGEAIGTGKVQENNGQLVTGGTVYSALENQKKDLSVHAGWGISVAKDKDGNAISLNRNLGRDAYTKDKAVLKADENKSALVIGGRVNPGDATGGQTAEKDYGALGQDSVTVGGADNTVRENGDAAVVVGGVSNTASAQYSTVIGGSANDALGNQSSVFGGHDNDAHGTYSTASGGSMNRAYGAAASVFGGGVNSALGDSSVAVGGLQSTVNGTFAVGIAGGSTNADYALAAGNGANVTVENGTAIGYQATTDEAGTIAFGHDAGDAYYSSTTWPQKATKQNGKYYDANNKEITKAEYDALKNSDGTWNDYSKTPTVVEKTYDKAAYNRLVKVADGKDDHDVVVMEQLTKATNDLTKDLSVNAGWGINIADEKDPKTGEVTKKNVISLNRNLGTNYGNKYGNGKVTFEADGENSLIIGGGAINDSLGESDKDFTFGAHAKDSVLVGGMNNDIDKNSERALIVGGTNNKTLSTNKVQQTGTDAIIVGGTDNKAEGDGAVLIGGNRNEASGLYSMTVGGTVNKNEGWLSSIFGGTRNNILKSDKSDPTGAAIFGGTDNTIEGEGIAATIFGGEKNVADNLLAVVVGGEANHSSGNASTVLGGNYNLANGTVSTAIGGQVNNAIGNGSVVVGGGRNLTSGTYSYASGGLYNNVTGTGASSLGGESSSVNGMFSTGVAGGSTGQDAFFSLAAGYQAVVADGGVEKTYLDENNPNDIKEMEKVEEAIQNGNMRSLPGYYMVDPNSSLGNAKFIHYDKFSTALGYQATANEPGTIAFGHDAGDESGYTYEWETLTDEKGNPKQNEIDGTTNDYTKAPKSIKKNEPYTSAYYNRLVKVADGIDDHDVVVMEQLKQYAEKDASNLGNNIEVYKTDKNGNVQLDENKKPVKDEAATTTAQKKSKDDWGKALGADPFTAGTATTATNASTSDQLVTGKTLYNYDKPTGSTNYVKVNNTTGQNLSALDAQVQANADTLNDKTHNIKYYSVDENAPLMNLDTYKNDGNDGAKGMGSLAAGFVTHADGIASTVAGSYSGVINQNGNGLDLRGAAALSYGTFNVNQNTDPKKMHSGVANSIVGQANMTTNSNAAIIYGAGNTVTDSYRPIVSKKDADILGSISDPTKLSKAMQDAVKESGGQVMVMGGGNNVESAYMSQVVGVGNTVKGNQVKNDKGEWATDTSTDTSNTAIQDYDPEKSSQYNYVDGFSNEVINGKHDYIIGANNKLDGDSYDDNNAKPIKRSNKSNVVIGDNHALTGKKNNVIIGSADTEGTLTRASDAVIIGHKANATSDTGADNAVAIGLSATAGGGNAVTIGVNTSAGDNSITIGSESSAISGENIAIGRYAKVYGYKVTKAVALGQKAEAHVADGVAIGSGSIATVAGKSTEEYDPATGQNSTETTSTWKATNAAVSIGKADGTVTRQINGVAAGTNDTDAVNVAQLKKLAGMKANVDASNIGKNLKGADGKTAAADPEKTANENTWGEAIGTGTVTNDDGSKQLVTGGTVYNEVRPSKDGAYVKMSQTTGANLLKLDNQVKTNTDKLSDVDSRSVKYDTKTVNDKTVVDNTKITLDGEGGTTITNLKDGANNSDAATVGQLNSKIAGVTYTAGNGIAMDSTAKTISAKAGNGITVDTNGINAKAGTGITVDADGINVNTGKHLNINANGKIDVDDSGEVAETGDKSQQLVTGKTVYDALHGGLDNITVGKDGKDGKDGSIGIAGRNGTNGYTMTIIKTEQGAAGVDGKDGITRVIYQDKDGSKKHTIATLDDGFKFKGDDSTVIAKKLDEQLNIIGGADSNNLTEGNIGVNSTTDKGQLKVQLAKDLTGITSISNQKTEGGKTTGAKITLGDDGSVNVNGGKITNVGSGADASGKYTETTNAANIGDVQKIAENTATGLTGKGLKFAANSGDEYTAKLGSTVKIQGTDKKEGHEYTADNLTTEIDEKGNITILMDKNVSAEKIAVNGKDGENGKPGTAGSIGISGQDGKAGVGIDGKDGISIKGQNGKDGVTIKGIDGVDGVDGLEGHIGLNGKDGMTDIFTTAGTPGLDGKDGETMTRIVYKDPKGTEHEAATLDDGLKFKGDDGKEIAKKLNNTLDIIGGAKGDLTEGNIGVNSTDKGQLKVQLAKDLKGITSISNQTTTKVSGKDVTTGAKVTLGADGSVDVNGGKITHVGSGADASGNYTTTTNAANIGDVQKIVKDAVDSAADTTNKALAGKANVDASNIGANLKGEDGKTPATEAEKTKNENAWGSAIGTGKIEANNGQLVTGKTVYEYNKPVAEDGKTPNYVSEGKTTGQNLGALDAQVKNNADAIKKNSESIQNITNNVKNLSDNAVQYDKDSNKKKVTLGGDGGTIITNVKDGALSDSSSDAVNGKQLYNEQEARKAADKVITEKVTNNTNEITKIKDGEGFTDKGKTVIKSLAQDAVDVKGSDNVTVTNETKDGTKTFTVSVDGNGKVASGDKGLISGDTIYNELRPSADGSYIKKDSTTAQNLVSLDTQVKKTSDLINSDGKTIKIGGSDAATKIDVNGKDGKGRVITGVVSDANDPTSAANVGYVNGVTAANTQQIYRDMNSAYGRLNNNINKAAAGSNALAALHPLDYDPDDKADFAVGYGHYRNANAAAVGAFYHPNENTMVNVGVSLGNGDPGFNAGVSFKVGRGGAGHEAMSKTEMAKVINSQSKEIDALKKDNADKDKRIDALEQKMAEILAKLDKNGK